VTWEHDATCETWGFYNPRDNTEHYTYLSSVPGYCSYPGLGDPEYGTNTYFP
jgi:hypothetical protein